MFKRSFMMASDLSEAPFPARTALNTDHFATHHYLPSQQCDPTPASPSPSPLDHPQNSLTYVPGEPTVDLTPNKVHDFLIRELNTPVLDEMYTRLWLVARKSGNSIDPLDRQRIKGREIVPTEDIKLHLVWHRDKIYLKPIPICLLNYDFWTAYLPSSAIATSPDRTTGQECLSLKFDRSVAIGFLRSYAFLIQHHTDFTLACQHHLIPDKIDWINWSIFIAHFRPIRDYQVTNRYHYGQLRLSRLNWAVRILRPQSASTTWYYEIPYWSTGPYMERAIAPLIFVFVTLSTILSSMQIVLSVPTDAISFTQLDISQLQALRRSFWIFSIMMLLLSCIVWILLLFVPFCVIWWQLSWGFRNKRNLAVEYAEPADSE